MPEYECSSSSIKGGILADHMGLGKTLSILSLITNTLEEARSVEAKAGVGGNHASGTTLIVTPVSSQWLVIFMNAVYRHIG